jgi:hypothetical protein
MFILILGIVAATENETEIVLMFLQKCGSLIDWEMTNSFPKIL